MKTKIQSQQKSPVLPRIIYLTGLTTGLSVFFVFLSCLFNFFFNFGNPFELDSTNFLDVPIATTSFVIF